MTDKIEDDGDDDSGTKIEEKGDIRERLTWDRKIRGIRWCKMRERRTYGENVVNIANGLVHVKKCA